MDIRECFWIAMIIIFFTIPIVFIVLDLTFFILKKERPIFELLLFLTGILYMGVALFAWMLPDYRQALNYFDTANAHEPVNLTEFPGLLVFVVGGFLCYFVLKFFRKKLPPLAEVFLIAGVYVGMALSLVWMVQLLCGARPEGVDASLTGGIGQAVNGKIPIQLDEMDYKFIFCLCVVPFLFLCHCIDLMVKLIKEKAVKQAAITYDNKILTKINLFLLKGANLFLFGIIALLPVLGFFVIILLLFGQQPDSAILAFTKTSDWILSGEIAPPPVAQDTHYLCTVSLRGHKKLVKPIRYGIRRGEKIVVNRQLCVANAFEQLLEEKTPTMHRKIRTFYDTYGYPISKHIRTAWSADVIYLLMKPLEWFFVTVLYLCDTKPENRIHSQYLPK